jgi:hypothetical protein
MPRFREYRVVDSFVVDTVAPIPWITTYGAPRGAYVVTLTPHQAFVKQSRRAM